MSVKLSRPQARPSMPGRRRRRWPIPALVAGIAVFTITTGLVFVRPPQGMPTRVDAIILLGGMGHRYPYALRLARAHRAPVLVISAPAPIATGSGKCAPRIPGVRIICFNPDPRSTQGEAEYAGRLERRYHWKTIALVAIAPQDVRARLRFERCLGAKVYVVNAPFGLVDWPYQILYGWGAMLKALVLQRSC
jgi:uncharacterized SAM-binding protein YcdF (DUF218 family)